MRITDARFPASDAAALAKWYADTLGAGPTFVSGAAGSVHHFAFHVANLEPWKRRLEIREEHAFPSWGGARAIYFRDPEENVVELIARPHARPELTLAEVGLPVDDVPAAVEALQRELGLPFYLDHGDEFTPLGDDDGLLILVRVGRPWFPFGVPAGRTRIELSITGAGVGTADLPGESHRVVGA
jgi:hypothetical protein